MKYLEQKMNKISAKYLKKTLLLSSVIILFSSAVMAQDNLALEEIVVTATKRAMIEGDTPLAIETITGESIVKGSITNAEDLSALIPNLIVGDALVTSTVAIRGMGSGADRAFEQSVGMFIDGIYMPRSRQYRAPFFDAERIEIIRGPQAVMFGLNSTAGAVNIVSAKTRPGDDPFLKLVGEYELDYEGHKVDLVAGRSLSDTVGARFAVRTRDSGKGYVTNQFTGEDTLSNDEMLARLTLVMETSENSSISIKADYAKFDMFGSTGELYGPGASNYDGGDGVLDWVQSVDGSLLQYITDDEPGLYQEAKNLAVNAVWQRGENTVSTMLGFSDSNYDFALDLDNTPLAGADASLREEYKQYSGEIRVSSPEEEKISYIAGVYIQSGDLMNSQPGAYGPVLLGGPIGIVAPNVMTQDSKTYSAFLSMTNKLSDITRVIFGVRYVREDKDVTRDGSGCNMIAIGYPGLADGTLLGPAPALCTTYDGAVADRSSNNLMPEIIFQKDVSEEGMFYAKVGKSVKSGGFAFSGTVVHPEGGTYSETGYDDENATGTELGYKTRLLGGRAELNLTAFHTKFKDMQLNSFQVDSVTGAVTAIVSNAGKAVTKGLEVEYNVAVNEAITWGVSAAYLSAKFKEFLKAPCNSVNATPSGICDYTGMKTPFAPSFSGSAYIDVRRSINADLDFVGNIIASRKNEYFTEGTLNPNAVQDDFTRWDARLGLARTDGSWELSLIGKNLTDEVVINFSQPFLGINGYIGAPRTLQVQFSVNF